MLDSETLTTGGCARRSLSSVGCCAGVSILTAWMPVPGLPRCQAPLSLVTRHLEVSTSRRECPADHRPQAAVTWAIEAATTSTTRSSSASVITNGGPSRMTSPSVPLALPVPE